MNIILCVLMQIETDQSLMSHAEFPESYEAEAVRMESHSNHMTPFEVWSVKDLTLHI